MIAISMGLAACATVSPEPASTTGPARAYPIDLAPARMDQLPPALAPFQHEWPAYWKGTVRGIRSARETAVSAWLVELLDPPERLGDYCVAKGLVWRYEVTAAGLEAHGSTATSSARREPVGVDCLATVDQSYFSVDPALMKDLPAILSGAAAAFACLGGNEADPDLCRSGRISRALVRMVSRVDAFEPVSLAQGSGSSASRSARLSYLYRGESGLFLIRVRLRERDGAWFMTDAEAIPVDA
ncbi:hypothetical protein [Wenzhouxiangella marina]|uniref:hypothetical protein n=1 Tax=Wenzhouxiangella marina TaxID=1579979 RepID=UPI0012E2DFD0|nr:hypothetical protein [Wenzhouxiangella marina]